MSEGEGRAESTLAPRAAVAQGAPRADLAAAPGAAAYGPSLGEIRRRYARAYAPRPWLYWLDLLASATVGWGAFAWAVASTPGSCIQATALVVAILAFLRGSIFIHELAHLRRRAVPGFGLAWHALVGLPFMLPATMYGTHVEHHRSAVFGTPLDPEYVPLAGWSGWRLAVFVLAVALVPPLLAIRWGVLGPISWLVPPLRRLLVESASTLVINPAYKRPMPQGSEARRFAVQEAGAAAFFWMAAALVWKGALPPHALAVWWIVSAGILVVNQVRTLAAHGYANEDGAPVSDLGQLLDSINLRGRLLTPLAAPLGMRFHALHHFLPTVPYHALGSLHRELVASLPPKAPYRRVERAGIVSAVLDLVRGRGPGRPSVADLAGEYAAADCGDLGLSADRAAGEA